MNRIIVYLNILLFLLLISCNINKAEIKTEKNADTSVYTVDTTYSFGTGVDIYEHLTPSQFLNHLLKFRVNTKGLNFLTYNSSHIDWIKIEDIDTLILRVYDTTKVRCIINPLSSYIPDSSSCIGREAQNMIEAFINHRGYLDFLFSYGKVDSSNAKKLINWYKNKN